MEGESFAGNFGTQMRKSYFNHNNDDLEIPCGFLKEFPVANSGEFFNWFFCSAWNSKDGFWFEDYIFISFDIRIEKF